MNYTITLPIPRPLLTTNESRSRHWRVSYRAKAETEMLVRSALRAANVPPQTQPVEVVVTWFAPDRRRRDSDAMDFTKKAVLDAMVKAGVLVDDDLTHVPRTTTGIRVDRDRPRIEIRIQSANQDADSCLVSEPQADETRPAHTRVTPNP